MTTRTITNKQTNPATHKMTFPLWFTILIAVTFVTQCGVVSAADDDEKKKPLFVLHVGPPKTGTTTLQYFLSEFRDTFREDNYLYVGRWYDEKGTWHGYQNREFANLVNYNCQVHDEEEDVDGLMAVYNEYFQEEDEVDDPSELVDWTHHRSVPMCWKSFLVELQRVRRMGNMNVFVSDEMLCIRGHNQEEFHFHVIRDAIARDWDVRIIATYRRFHAWLPSEKNQYDQYRLSDWAEIPRWLEWDGTPIPAMYQYVKNAVEDPEKIKYPYLNDIVRDYGVFFDVEVMNMHDLSEHKTLASQLICDFLPNATKTCELSKREEQNNKTASMVLNAAKSGYYDIMAMAANVKGLVDVDRDPERLTRPYVRDQIEWEHEKVRNLKPEDLPLVCPEREEIEPLLQKSLAYEEEFFPEFHKANKEKHVAEFDKMFAKKRYCSVDAETVLKEQYWIDFLKRLNNGHIHDIPSDEEEEEDPEPEREQRREVDEREEDEEEDGYDREEMNDEDERYEAPHTGGGELYEGVKGTNERFEAAHHTGGEL